MKKEHKHFIAGTLAGFMAGVAGIFTLAWLHKPTQDHLRKHVKLARMESARLMKEQAHRLES